MLQTEVIEKKSKKNFVSQLFYFIRCDSCSEKESRRASSVEDCQLKAGQDGWRYRFGTGSGLYGKKYDAATWHCTSCVQKGCHLSTEEKLQRKLAGLSQDELDRIFSTETK